MDKSEIETRFEYSLNKRQLKRWIYDSGYTRPWLAKKLHMSTEELKRRLIYEQSFSLEEIRILAKLMGVESVFRVICFSTYQQKQRLFSMLL